MMMKRIMKVMHDCEGVGDDFQLPGADSDDDDDEDGTGDTDDNPGDAVFGHLRGPPIHPRST